MGPTCKPAQKVYLMLAFRQFKLRLFPAAIVLAACVFTQAAQASLLGVGDSETSQSLSSSSSNDPLPYRPAELHKKDLNSLPPGHAAHSNVSSSGGFGIGPMLLNELDLIVPDNGNVSKLYGERNQAIPDSPLFGLFRPPRCCA